MKFVFIDALTFADLSRATKLTPFSSPVVLFLPSRDSLSPRCGRCRKREGLSLDYVEALL